MKPNDKAINEALSVTQIPGGNMREYMRRVLEAAYAAQFQREDYAGLVEELREELLQFDLKDTAYENTAKEAADAIEALLAKLNNKLKPSEDYADLIRSLRGEPPTNSTLDPLRAADALEAVLAERDALKGANNELREENELVGKQMDKFADQIEALETERDALAARLAPVDDEKLVEIAAIAIRQNESKSASQLNYIDLTNIIRGAIAAIRPHIEAAERERCAKALEITSDEIRLHAGEMSAQEMRSVLSVLTWRAAAIRSGK